MQTTCTWEWDEYQQGWETDCGEFYPRQDDAIAIIRRNPCVCCFCGQEIEETEGTR